MNGNDRFLNVNDAHLRVTGGNVHASSFNLDQISITTTSTTSSTIDFLNETKAFNTRSNIEVGTANLFVDTTTSNVGIQTTSPEYALDVHGPANVSVLTANTVTGFDGTLYLGSHLLPTQNQQFDIGSAEKKIRHLYLSNNSLWIGDDSKISVVEGKMKFLKRNKNIVPSGTEALGGNATDALAHAQNSDPSLNNINQMKLEHWLAYTKSLDGGADKDIKDIFTTDTSNYESVTASEAFKEYDDTNIYSLNKLRLGSAAAAEATLDVVGTIKATSDLTVNTNTFHVDATNSRVGVGTTSPGSKLDVEGVLVAKDTTETQTLLNMAGDLGGGNNTNEYTPGHSHLGAVQIVSEPVHEGFSSMCVISKDRENNTTKNASIGFFTSDTQGVGKYVGKIGFWPEDADSLTGQFRIYSGGGGGQGAGYTLPLQTMVVKSNGNVGIGEANPTFKLDVLGGSTRIRSSTTGGGYIELGGTETNPVTRTESVIYNAGTFINNAGSGAKYARNLRLQPGQMYGGAMWATAGYPEPTLYGGDTVMYAGDINAGGNNGTGAGQYYAGHMYIGAGIAWAGGVGSNAARTYNGNIYFQTGTSDTTSSTDLNRYNRMTILTNGNVGINITDPDSPLEVRGNIQTSYSSTDHGIFIENVGTIRRDYGNNGAGFHITGGAIWGTDYAGNYSNGGVTWGSSAHRWGQIYSSVSTIASSDGRLKQDIADITDSERRVASKIIPLLKTYRLKDAVEKKGDEARTHTGIIAQDLIAAFESEGLDAHRYGLFCYDEKWTVDGEHELTETVYQKNGSSEYTNEDGDVIKYTADDEGVEAVKHKISIFANKDTPGAILDSTIYSIRYEELLCFIVSAMATEEKVATLETQLTSVLARLDALEGA